MTTNTYTLKTNPAKFANLHGCDAAYWPMTCDWGKAQDLPTLTKSLDFVAKRLANIVKAKAFKPENIALAKELGKLVKAECEALSKPDADLNVETFKCYQIERYMFRLWYRDTRAAREATEPKPAKQEKPKADKAPAKQEKPKAEKKAPAKQEIAKANEALFVSKLTKAQKRELALALLSELLK